MLLNQQKAEKPVNERSSSDLDIVDLWHTIQGEGPSVGVPAVFIRVAGCNLECPFCDTDYTTGRQLVAPAKLLQGVEAVRHGGTELIVVTGGEPFRQRLAPFVKLALDEGFSVQLETNGTLYLQDLPYEHSNLSVVCAPKAQINSKLKPHITALKYVVEAGCIDSQTGLPYTTLGNTVRAADPTGCDNAEIFIQPLDEQNERKNKENLEVAIWSCLTFGYRLCVQTHKIIGVK